MYVSRGRFFAERKSDSLIKSHWVSFFLFFTGGSKHTHTHTHAMDFNTTTTKIRSGRIDPREETEWIFLCHRLLLSNWKHSKCFFFFSFFIFFSARGPFFSRLVYFLGYFTNPSTYPSFVLSLFFEVCCCDRSNFIFDVYRFVGESTAAGSQYASDLQ